ncbi:MAG: hypothetical protein M3135_03710 [Actinomycetota bacterium]|nr:hypothetical protein [Actinomycetota bacterium]
MNELENRIRDVLLEDASRAPVVVRMPGHVRPRVRRRQAATSLVAAAAALAVVGAAVLSVRGLESSDRDRETAPASDTRPVFERTATVGGLTVTSPSDWYLVDPWGAWDPDGVSPESDAILLEVANFDPGLSRPVCDVAAGRSARFPANGVALFVKVGSPGLGVDDDCGGQIDTSIVGTVGPAPYRIVMAVGSDAATDDLAIAEAIRRSLRWEGQTFSARELGAGYVLDGWRDEGSIWLLEARPSAENVELLLVEFSGNSVSYDTVADVDVPALNAVEGESFGAVTQDAVRVEFHRAGLAAPMLTRLIDLPPSLHAAFDAYVVVPQPTGGPFEVVALGADGAVLGSNLPGLVDTERVGTVRAFGARWNVKVSRAADGSLASSCVELAEDRTPAPCDRDLGGGVPVQTFPGPNPAVFVTQEVGDVVEAIDVVSEDGRVFHAVMLPSGGGASVAVVALEGEGRGRFVYQLRDGRTDEGRRPEAHVEWPNLGQLIGGGSFPEADQT